MSDNTQTLTLAGGCFWCTEGLYTQTPGILNAVSGFAGGTKENPSYDEVASGNTDYREAIQITYDPTKISEEEIFALFWRNIDPTDDAGQFVDRGHQYTTAIYYHTKHQKQIAQQSKNQLEASGKFDEPIVTEILPYTTFYPAEDHHQGFSQKHPFRYELYKKGSGRVEYEHEYWN